MLLIHERRFAVSEPLDELSILEFTGLDTSIGKSVFGFSFSLVIEPGPVVDVTTLVVVDAVAMAHSILVLAYIILAIGERVLSITVLFVIYPVSHIGCT